jgi:hypothetical protein
MPFICTDNIGGTGIGGDVSPRLDVKNGCVVF